MRVFGAMPLLFRLNNPLPMLCWSITTERHAGPNAARPTCWKKLRQRIAKVDHRKTSDIGMV